MQKLKAIKCRDSDEYLKKLSLNNSDWWDQNTQCHWIFRGQPSVNYKLLPSIYRVVNKTYLYRKLFKTLNASLVRTVPDMQSAIKNNVKSLGKLNAAFRKRLIELVKARFIEVELVKRFLFRCNEIGLKIPTIKIFANSRGEISPTEYLYNHIFYDYLKNFTGNDQNYIHLPTEFRELFKYDYPDTIALARHHGIATRYLDWTTDPLIAAFFSACESSDSDSICVWALNTRYINDSLTQGQIRFHKNLKHDGLEFLHKQKGLFTEMWGCEGYYFHHGEWPTLEKYLTKTNAYASQNDYLRRIDLKKKYIPSLLKKLDRMGINKCQLMPTYDNVAQLIMNEIKSVAKEA